MLLNFGHTVGHAIERVTGYQSYTHGEAVAIGMAVACRLGVRLGVTPEPVASLLPPVLARLGLPFAAPELAAAEVAAAVVSDKKNRSGMIHLVLLQEIGRAIIVPIEEDRVVQLVSEVGRMSDVTAVLAARPSQLHLSPCFLRGTVTLPLRKLRAPRVAVCRIGRLATDEARAG
jgi:hypothetical protein